MGKLSNSANWLRARSKSTGSTSSPELRNSHKKAPRKVHSVDCDNSRDKMLLDYQMMKYCFEGFPPKMLATLIAREEGNMKAVAADLCNRGWGVHNPLLDTVSDSINSHFTLSYYWGEIKPEYLEELQSQNCGSFFTAYESTNSYSLYFLDDNREIQKKTITSPSILNDTSLLEYLKYPLDRPCKLSPLSLVPFLSEH